MPDNPALSVLLFGFDFELDHGFDQLKIGLGIDLPSFTVLNGEDLAGLD
jgi:hypothetical protein